MSYPRKTPVTLLQEVCFKKNVVPQYELINLEGAVHDPVFTYCVTVDNIVEYGCGHSKKHAKHEAAKALLQKLIGTWPETYSFEIQKGYNKVKEIFDSYDYDIPGNPIGILQELCTAERWPHPAYTISVQQNSMNKKIFITSCMVGKFVMQGKSNCKKTSKRIAAHQMCKHLQKLILNKFNYFDSLVIPNKLMNNVSAKKIMADENDKNQKFQSKTVLTRDAVKNLVRYFIELNLSNKSSLQLLKNFSIGRCRKMSPIELLWKFAADHNFEIKYEQVNETSGQIKCLMYLSTIPHNYRIACFGVGKTFWDAKVSVACTAISYLKLMMKNTEY